MRIQNFFSIFYLCCLFLFPSTTFADSFDSMSLNDTTVLSHDIKKARNTGSPIGSVIIWTEADMPEDAENWLECNGQAVSATKHPELYKKMKTTPDYRGRFLRGHGGKSGNLGVVQSDAINGNETFTATITGMSAGSVSFGDGRATGNDVPRSASVMKPGGWQGGFQTGLKIKSSSNATETRPENIAIRYLIRASD